MDGCWTRLPCLSFSFLSSFLPLSLPFPSFSVFPRCSRLCHSCLSRPHSSVLASSRFHLSFLSLPSPLHSLIPSHSIHTHILTSSDMPQIDGQPLQILDFPDEILQKILGYCCSDEDLGFLLWSCRLVTTKDQFCHQCYHCTLCHGPYSHIPRMPLHLTPLHGSQTATTTPVTTACTDCKIVATGTQSQQGLGRRRRRRLPVGGMGIAQAVLDGQDGDRGLVDLDLGYLFTGVRRCPWNNHQRWGYRHGNSSCSIGGNDTIGVRPLPMLLPSRIRSLFAAAAAAVTAAGVMQSDRTIVAGNGDPVVHVPGG